MTGDAWIDTVRIAQDFGGITTLLPPGVSALLEAPWPLLQAVRFAQMVISWDQLEDKDRPPRRIWQDQPALRAHMDRLKRDRRERAEDREIEDPVHNAAADMLLTG